MTWIGGIQTRADIDEDEMRKTLNRMLAAACPTNPSPNAAPHSFASSVVDAAHGKALLKLCPSVEEAPSGHIYTDHQEKLVLVYDGRLYDSDGAGARPSDLQNRRNGAVAESLIRLLAKLPGKLDDKVSRALTSLDGDYALAVSNSDQTVVCRDSLGTKPLYFGQDERFAAFASNKKPLWKIGLGEVTSLRAAMLASFDSGGIAIKEASPLDRGEVEITEMALAVSEYQQGLYSAIRKRLAGMTDLHRVGVLLSGGVDSCLLARMVHDIAPGLGMDVIAYTVGLPDSPDVNSARQFAQELGIRHEMKVLSIEQIEQYIPEVIEAVEDSDFVQIETGIGIYAAVDMASKAGVRVLFSGQGADEQWGGYSWYPRVLGKDGRDELCRRMWEDFSRADIETLDRENKIAMAYGAELLFPYLDGEVIDVARRVASELKVISQDDHLGKHPHRQLATKMGIPARYANRGKLAIQHGTGIHDVLDEIARRNGFDPGLIKNIGYKNDEITAAKMGSSSRYGYRYAAKKLWQVPPHVQLFLHALAYKRGLLDQPVRDRIACFLNRAEFTSGVSA